MGNIFSPRVAFDNKGVQIDYKSPTSGPFDKYYIDKTFKLVPKLLEGSEDEYTLDVKVIISKRDCTEVIESQASDVGLDNILRRFVETGDTSILPQPMQASDEILDLTKLPQDNAEYFEYIHGLVEKFNSLPIELRKDMTLDQFVKNVRKSDVEAYLDSLKKVEKTVEKKDEGAKDE